MTLAKHIDKETIKAHKPKLKKLDSDFQLIDDNYYFIIEREKEIIGYAYVANEKNRYVIKCIFIKNSERFKSNGTKLLDAIIYWAESQNIEEIYADKNKNSDYFFKSNNFVENEKYLIRENLLKDKKRKVEGVKGTLISVGCNIMLAILKMTFGIFGQSKALFADGLHSLSDVVTSLVVLISIKFASIPPDENHPYGHGQIEAISGNSIGLILVVTAVLLLQENIVNLFQTKIYTMPKTITLYVVVFSIIVKYILYVYKIKMGHRLKNHAIIADAKDHKSDVMSSIGVLVGLILAIQINPVFDTVAGILVAVLIGKEGVGIIFDTSNKIMDKQEDDFLREIDTIVSRDERIENIHNLIMKSAGNKIYLSFHIRVDKDTTIEKSHEIVDDLVKNIRQKYPDVKGITVHTDPIRE